MEENKLSTNLEQINASVSDIRSTLGAEGVSIDELSIKVGEVKTNLDELENNMVYQVNTREEMYALNNVSEGSTCLVKGQEIRPTRVEDKFTMIYFPETVTLPVGFPAESFSLYIADTGHGAVSGTLSGPYFDFTMIIKGQGSYGKNIKYVATTEGNQYVYHRQDTFGSPVQSAGELSYQTFGPCASEFFRILDEFEETYIYREGGWAQYSLEEVNELNFMIEEQNQMINDLDAEIDTLNITIDEQEITIQDLREQLNNIPTGGSGDVLLASTIAEMNTLEAEEGQLCLIYEDLTEVVDWTTDTVNFTIPETFIFPSSLTRISLTIKSSDTASLVISVSNTGDRWNGTMRYTDAAGTRTTASLRQVVVEGEIAIAYFTATALIGTTITFTSPTFSGTTSVIPFISRNGSTSFGGLYQKLSDSWIPVDSGLTTQATDVISGTFYSGRSIKEGTFATDTSDAAMAKKLDIIKAIDWDCSTLSANRTLASLIASGSDSLNTLQFARMIKVKLDQNINGSMFENFGVNSTFEIPVNFTYDLPGWDMSANNTCPGMFQNFLQGNESARANFKKLDLSGWVAPDDSCSYMFAGANVGREIDFSSLYSGQYGAFMRAICLDNTMLEKIDLSNVSVLSSSDLTLDSAFSGCSSLRHIDIRNMEITSVYITGKNTFTGVPTDCLIIVKDDEVRNIIKTEYPDFTNIKTVAEYTAH